MMLRRKRFFRAGRRACSPPVPTRRARPSADRDGESIGPALECFSLPADDPAQIGAEKPAGMGLARPPRRPGSPEAQQLLRAWSDQIVDLHLAADAQLACLRLSPGSGDPR